MIITDKNQLAAYKTLSILSKQIKGIPNVFNSQSFAVKNKLVKFHSLTKDLKIYEAGKGHSAHPNVGNYQSQLK